MKQLCTVLLSVLPFISYCQAPAIKWLKSYGGSNVDMAYALCKTPAGGFITAGYATSNDGDVINNHSFRVAGDYWVVNVDSLGNKLWAKTYGGNHEDEARMIEPTKDGGYIMGGFSNSDDSNITSPHGNLDYWIVKISKGGTKQWEHAYGGTGNDYAVDIKQTSDGGYLVAGYTYSTNGDVVGNHGSGDAWMLKLDKGGSIIWKKCYGGSKDDEINKMALTPDGGCILIGSSGSNDGDVSGNHGGVIDMWIVKLDVNGNVQWQKCMGGSNDDNGYSIKTVPGGGYVIAGSSGSSDGDLTGLPRGFNQDFWMIKLKNDASIDWQKMYGGGSDDIALDVVVTSSGDYIFSGSTDNILFGDDPTRKPPNAWFFKCSSDGTPAWQKFVGGNGADYPYAIMQAGDDFIFAGASYSNDRDITGNHGNYDFIIGKLSPTTLPITLTSFTAQKQHADVLLQWQTATEVNSKQFNIQRSSDGSRFTTIGITPAAGNSATLKTYSYIDVAALLQPGTLYYRLEQVDKDGSRYYSKVAVIKNLPADVFMIMPNPVKSTITVQSKINAAHASVQLSDMNGKVIYTSNKAISAGYLQIPAANLAAGRYNLIIQANGDKYVVRVVKE